MNYLGPPKDSAQLQLREVPDGPDGLEVELVDGAEAGHVLEVGRAPLEGRVAIVRGARHGREPQVGEGFL